MISDNNILKAALIQIADSELETLESIANTQPHIFSEAFLGKMDDTIGKSYYRDNNNFGRKVRRSSWIAIAATLILCFSITVYAIVKSIPINIDNQNELNPNAWDLTTESSNDPTVQESFEYKTPETPEGFSVTERIENPLSLVIYYENNDGSNIIYTQAFGEEGHANINTPDSDALQITEETINDRKAIITQHYDGIYSIVVEDGTSVFLIAGSCDYNILFNMALEATSAN